MDYSWEFVLSAIVLIIAVRNVKVAIYYLKFAYYYGTMTIVMTSLIPYFLLRPKNVRNFLTNSAGCKHVSSVLGIKWIHRGSENLSKDRTCVIVANHQSSLDVQGMIDMWPTIGKMTALAKRELLFMGTFGVAMYLAGLKYVDRNSKGNVKEINNAMSELKKKNIKLWVFPEGTRRNTGEIHEFKKGAFLTAIQAQVPIVPVVFSSYKHFLNTKEKTFGKGDIIVTALPEILTEGLTEKDVDSLIQKTRSLMIKTYIMTTKEIEADLHDESYE